MTVDDRQLDKISQFEARMEVVAKDDPDRAQACRQVHNMLVNAKHVVESIFNDDVADQAEVVLSVHAAIADELEDIKAEKRGDYGDEDEDEDEDGEHA